MFFFLTDNFKQVISSKKLFSILLHISTTRLASRQQSSSRCRIHHHKPALNGKGGKFDSPVTCRCWTYLRLVAASSVVVSPMSLVGAGIVGLVRILAADFGRPLRRRVLMGDTQVLRGGSVGFVMLGQRVVDFARVVAVLRQSSYSGAHNTEELGRK